MSDEHTVISYTKKELPSSVGKLGIALLAIGLLLIVISYFVDSTRSAFNNLVLLMFLASIGVGSLFLVAIEYLGGAVWSTPFRRVTELVAGIVLILPVIAVPVYFNLHELFHWTHVEVVEVDKILSGKAAYLNESFFTIRVIVFFVIWILFYYLITKNSKKQDSSGDQKLTKLNIKLSAVFIPFFGLTITFASIDWIMSLEPHWFSTIYGVYYFSGTVLAALSVTTFIVVWMNERGLLAEGIKRDHYYSLGALLFAFINFWGYIAFSQYLLIFYANLPEETYWFLQRWEGSWMYFTIAFLIIHFIVPYFGLVSQPSKMNPKRLMFMSIWILGAHFMDVYWLVMPTFSKEGIVLGWMELGFPITAVGLVIMFFAMRSKKANLIPIGDPKLKRGLNFRL